MIRPHGVQNVETVYTWRMFRIMIATVTDANGKSYGRLVEDHGSGAVVLAYDAERRTALLIRQFRAPVNMAGVDPTMLLEPVGGLLEGDDATICARKEAMEEAGVRLDCLEHVATAWTLPSVSTEQLSLFLARYSAIDRVAAGGGLAEEDEDIDVVEVPLQQLVNLVNSEEKIDLKLLVLVQALQLRHPELFH
jgi:nudix-type nucleoside diphosphatase (YffH/AdpP family)